MIIEVELFRRDGRGYAREVFQNKDEAIEWINKMRLLPAWRKCRAHIDAREMKGGKP